MLAGLARKARTPVAWLWDGGVRKSCMSEMNYQALR